MVSEGRLSATIDQMKQLIYFKAGPRPFLAPPRPLLAPSQSLLIISFPDNANAIEDWDRHIEHVCNSVNGLIDLISAKYPQWVAKNVN